jgi:hypothetical protein
VVAGYLRREKIAKPKKPARIVLKGVANNPGFAE